MRPDGGFVKRNVDVFKESFSSSFQEALRREQKEDQFDPMRRWFAEVESVVFGAIWRIALWTVIAFYVIDRFIL